MWHNVCQKKIETNIFKFVSHDWPVLFRQNFAPPFFFSSPNCTGWGGGGDGGCLWRGAQAGWLAEVLGVSGGQVPGAGVAEQTPDPVLSINLNPDLPGPKLG